MSVVLDNNEILKKEYAHLDCLYFNSAYFGPSPYRAKQKISNSVFKELDPSFYPYNTWMGVAERTRKLFADVCGLDVDGVFHSTSSSDINSIIANGLDLKKDDVVCSLKGEYPSNVLPWMLSAKNRGHQFEIIDTDVLTASNIESLLPKNTKVISFSWVSFATGRKTDIESVGKILRKNGIFFVLDVTQGLGGLKLRPNEIKYIDAFSCSTYKWMLGGYGHAFGYLSKDAIEKITPTQACWNKSITSKDLSALLDYTLDTLPGARKFDRGQTSNMLANSCLEAGLELLEEIGLDKIEVHNQTLRNHFVDHFPRNQFELITPKSAGSNIVSLKSKSGIDTTQLEEDLKYHNVDVSVRDGKLRLSFHLFNTLKQVDTLLSILNS